LDKAQTTGNNREGLGIEGPKPEYLRDTSWESWSDFSAKQVGAGLWSYYKMETTECFAEFAGAILHF
jgi:hypothetical protein